MVGGLLAIAGSPVNFMPPHAHAGVWGPMSSQPGGVGRMISGDPGSPRFTGASVIPFSLM